MINPLTENVPLYYRKVSIVDRRLTGDDLRGKRILNIGCGPYVYSDLYFSRKGAKVVGIDYDKKEIERANEMCKKAIELNFLEKGLDYKFEYGDGRSVKYEDNSFDMVVSFSAIEHMPTDEDRIRVIKEMARVVKPGGSVVLTGPNLFNPFVTSWEILRTLLGIKMDHRYNPFKMKKMLEKEGLRVEEFDGASLSYVNEDFLKIKFGISLPKVFNKLLFAPFLALFKIIDSFSFLKIFRMRIGYRATKII